LERVPVPKLPEQASTSTRALFTVEQFCDDHQISPAFYYKLRKQGRGPVEIKLGSLTRISPESAAAWRRRMQRKRKR
jgi:hypothetical protein